MPVSRPRAPQERAEHIIVRRDQVEDSHLPGGVEKMDALSIIGRILRRTHTKRSAAATNNENPTATTASTNLTYTGPPPTLITLAWAAQDPQSPSTGALADNEPMETVVVSLEPPPKPHHDNNTGISQTTEHLLIAAGSIGATIIIVMIAFAVYTMRKRGISLRMVVNRRNDDSSRAPSRWHRESKQAYDDDYSSTSKSMRSGSLSSGLPAQSLARSNSFNQYELERNALGDQDRINSHRRNDSATPSSPVLPSNNQRGSASTHNTRSLDGNESDLVYPDPPRPPPPTFKQFMSSRPSISQRPGIGGAIASRFSWTNSQAPQTPHDPYDTASQPRGRDSYMTQASEAPRFRTIDSWVNQQSNRVDTDRLKQQFRMTQSSTYSADDYGDEVPAMPPVPKGYAAEAGVPEREREARHVRHESHATTTTAPIFKHHPGNEVRFSTRSTVPSEVLDMGRRNAAL